VSVVQQDTIVQLVHLSRIQHLAQPDITVLLAVIGLRVLLERIALVAVRLQAARVRLEITVLTLHSHFLARWGTLRFSCICVRV
jgi:hypothetical protein